ncbi:Beta-barrel assembly machine subunit BamB [Methylophilus rhizosphaerae]|uniref:Outer membrane protein assembly factor BamB n=2 Tax=Methylophilus rhizosphaerae TaxID=492660 RepID=A0A1G9B3E6_9PROT|nr:Beta-barrel assembly machine subunit BamB [Methylophilus rhizosphaerae]
MRLVNRMQRLSGLSALHMKKSRIVNYLALSVLLALGSGLSACSGFTDLKNNLSESIFGAEPANPPVELEPIKSSYDMRIAWSTDVGEAGRFTYSPVVADNFIYTVNAGGTVMQLAADSGKLQWKTELEEPISSSVGLGGGLVLAGTSKGRLYALNMNGKKVWSAILSSEIQGQPRYYDGTVIVRTSDHHIYGIDAADGRRKWVYERATPSLSLKTQAGIVVDSGAIYAGFPGGKLVAIRADNGKLLWEATVAQPKGVTEIERIADITSLPFVDGAVVYVVAYQGKVAAVDRQRGQVIWSRDISSYIGLTADNGKIYLSHTIGSVYSLDTANGKTFWRQGNLGYRHLTIPLPLSNIVAVGDLEGYVHLLSQDDGSFVGRTQLGSKPLMSLVAGSNNQFFAQSRDGHLYAVTYK